MTDPLKFSYLVHKLYGRYNHHSELYPKIDLQGMFSVLLQNSTNLLCVTDLYSNLLPLGSVLFSSVFNPTRDLEFKMTLTLFPLILLQIIKRADTDEANHDLDGMVEILDTYYHEDDLFPRLFDRFFTNPEYVSKKLTAEYYQFSCILNKFENFSDFYKYYDEAGDYDLY